MLIKVFNNSYPIDQYFDLLIFHISFYFEISFSKDVITGIMLALYINDRFFYHVNIFLFWKILTAHKKRKKKSFISEVTDSNRNINFPN